MRVCASLYTNGSSFPCMPPHAASWSDPTEGVGAVLLAGLEYRPAQQCAGARLPCVPTRALANPPGARVRHELDRERLAYKALYAKHTMVERINSQAAALAILHPKLRRGQAMVNHNTLTAVLITRRALQRVRAAATEGRPTESEDHPRRERLISEESLGGGGESPEPPVAPGATPRHRAPRALGHHRAKFAHAHQFAYCTTSHAIQLLHPGAVIPPRGARALPRCGPHHPRYVSPDPQPLPLW